MCEVNGISSSRQVAVLSSDPATKYNRITEKSSNSESQSSKLDDSGLRTFVKGLLEGK